MARANSGPAFTLNRVYEPNVSRQLTALRRLLSTPAKSDTASQSSRHPAEEGRTGAGVEVER
jgi:hypothetical protein